MTFEKIDCESREHCEPECNHDWKIHDLLIESSVRPDVFVWKCLTCGLIKNTITGEPPV